MQVNRSSNTSAMTSKGEENVRFLIATQTIKQLRNTRMPAERAISLDYVEWARLVPVFSR